MISPRWTFQHLNYKLQQLTTNLPVTGEGRQLFPSYSGFVSRKRQAVMCSVIACSPRYFCQKVANNCWVSDRNLKLVLPGPAGCWPLSVSPLTNSAGQNLSDFLLAGKILIERLDSCDICVSDMIHMTSWCKWGINNLSDWMCDGPLPLSLQPQY